MHARQTRRLRAARRAHPAANGWASQAQKGLGPAAGPDLAHGRLPWRDPILDIAADLHRLHRRSRRQDTADVTHRHPTGSRSRTPGRRTRKVRLRGCFPAGNVAAVVAFPLAMWMARGLAAGGPGVDVALATATPESRSGGLMLSRRPFRRLGILDGMGEDPSESSVLWRR